MSRLFGVAGYDRRPAVPPGEQAVAVIDPKSAFGVGVGRVAVVAVVRQERTDLFLEELELGGVGRLRLGRRAKQQQHRYDSQ
jgi:hypothetical protein